MNLIFSISLIFFFLMITNPKLHIHGSNHAYPYLNFPGLIEFGRSKRKSNNNRVNSIQINPLKSWNIIKRAGRLRRLAACIYHPLISDPGRNGPCV